MTSKPDTETIYENYTIAKKKSSIYLVNQYTRINRNLRTINKYENKIWILYPSYLPKKDKELVLTKILCALSRDKVPRSISNDYISKLAQVPKESFLIKINKPKILSCASFKEGKTPAFYTFFYKKKSRKPQIINSTWSFHLSYLFKDDTIFRWISELSGIDNCFSVLKHFRKNADDRLPLDSYSHIPTFLRPLYSGDLELNLEYLFGDYKELNPKLSDNILYHFNFGLDYLFTLFLLNKTSISTAQKQIILDAIEDRMNYPSLWASKVHSNSKSLREIIRKVKNCNYSKFIDYIGLSGKL